MTLSGKIVVVLGAGRSGRAAAALALREGAEVHVHDASPSIDGMPVGVQVHPGATVEKGGGVTSDLLVISPGIDTYGPLVAAYSQGAGEVIGETELGYRYYEGRIVGITGTNGKTTTTELVERILKAGGYDAAPCGNYGHPLCEIVLRDPMPNAVALELSSFQLETIKDFRPDVSIWLNFAPDHMDRYPTVQSYFDAKFRIFMNQTADQKAIVRTGENLPAILPELVTFSTEDPEADWFSDGRRITRRGVEVLDLEASTRMRGLHNAENAMAAIAACEAIGIPIGAARTALDGYAPPLHRCELVRTLDGVEYLNDSKATNLHALESALRSQTRPVVLIAGGKEKGLDYAPVVPLLEKKAVAAVTYGQIAAPLAGIFSAAVPVNQVTTLAEAVEAARKLAPRGATVLLSPGTSSFDQFSGYEQRGDVFRDLVLNLR
ncbi:UDP-N-acetylmuramoyl-L-alanine--D-glutamate ligase [Luteolibacter flavescens]|uniref:UDP-N-acetylmuramoylalanine--D-glutamate ligase n=1 Tax=Luteolibacter flavescens TaxID=1859460 RepID=A0ABT3FMN8_9BACT|nr:UDP-N-acetylmuramoyl-L-alanine--D-glutamate ligase [Luteolibacter flavescens]MCW1884836.1 UDP-N-acetylmuramoyl-L-alanine--D-glutamate ligase [Luteolibacter flavescens]